MEALLPLVTQLIAGAIGGNAASAALKQNAINVVARTIAGAIGGVAGGMLLSMVGGEAAMTGLIADGIGGLIGGGILSTLAGLVMARAHR
ncbi:MULTISPECIES: hypothetical protein [unclassified Rhizobium]|uniref:hypothetical protein n=1 Tax=unclassified Rhizobium TaxID=2613769 RepID=UPI001A99CF00|nr:MULTISPECIES: hypothetical protein [unclassified Rhizobium]MBX5160005.1 hypothetical protein [Rhizobium sp. NZLR8]MBX5166176.1 hypothetical protein [Rhizobium sp. NZLR4b]MBX5170255.1 hypothetical protein [Rhizobium sp. NZLR1b]MBX5185679.1 hypothetical protein [Rhizobium sp. NZLR5]MBX5189918.1 hypothetical protein [Rhizobium sp. NZLR3b]